MTIVITTRITDELNKQLKTLAKEKNLSVGLLVRQLIEERFTVNHSAEHSNVMNQAVLETRILTRFLIRHLSISEEEQNQILNKARLIAQEQSNKNEQ